MGAIIWGPVVEGSECLDTIIIIATFWKNVSGVPQGSIVGPRFLNIFFNDFFYVILIASSHNYADDNTFTSFGKTLEDLIKKLEHECEVALAWFRNNKMMVNPNKFEAILLNKSKSTHVTQRMNIGNEKIESLSS